MLGSLIRRNWAVGALAVAGLAGCATSDSMLNRWPTTTTMPPAVSVPAEPAPNEATSVVLLRLRQTLHGAPAPARKALWPWLANIDKAEPLHRVDSDPLSAELAAQGWIAWRLPAGAYHVVIAAYATNGVQPRIVLDRYRFSVPAAGRAFYLGSTTYACEPAWWFEALCPDPPRAADDLALAQPVAAALGLASAEAARFEAVASASPRTPGSEPGRIPQLDPSQTLLMVGEGPSVRAVHDFLAQARDERGISLEVGARTWISLAPYGPLAIIAVPATAITEIGVAMHRYRLTQKMECLQRVWDSRADALARDALGRELRRAMAGPANDAADAAPARPLTVAEARGRYRRLLALDIQRLSIESCHPSSPWLPDPRGKRFCMETAVRARVYGPDAGEALSDEVFAFVPQRRVGHEFEPTGWPIPPGYLYETPLPGPAPVTRSYDDYCAADGFALVEADLRRMLEAIVPQVLARHGIVPAGR